MGKKEAEGECGWRGICLSKRSIKAFESYAVVTRMPRSKIALSRNKSVQIPSE